MSATPSPQVGQSGLGGHARASKSVRPRGVTVLAALNFLVAGIFTILLFSAVLDPQPATANLPMPSGNFDTWLDGIAQDTERELIADQNAAIFISAVINVPVGLLVGIGLWRLARWGRKLALLFYGGSAMLILLFSYSMPLTGSTLLSVVTRVVAFVYLMHPDVHMAFQRQHGFMK